MHRVAAASGARRAHPCESLTAVCAPYWAGLQATSYAIQQEEELCDQEPFDCADGPDRPMLELQAGSRVYFQASIIRESKTEIRVLFPGGFVCLVCVWAVEAARHLGLLWASRCRGWPASA